jgi:L,D-transpeptidase catalytic domain
MAVGSAHGGALVSGLRGTRALLGIGVAVVVVLVAIVVAVLVWSGVTLANDSTALARVAVQPFGGKIERVEAYGPDGRRIPITVQSGRLIPQKRLTPGEQVSVEVVVRRPGWLSWLLGKRRHEQLTLRAPVAKVTEHWLTVPAGSDVRVSFDRPVSAVAYGSPGGLTNHALSSTQSTYSLGTRSATGTTEIALAPRPWERVGTPTQVSWFPPSRSPVMVTLPAPGAQISPTTKLELTFSKPVSEVLGSARPQLQPSTPGRWHQSNSHTLTFTPDGFGLPLGSHLQIRLPHAVAVTASTGGLRTTNQIEWTVPAGSTLRLQQLLAQAGYLPVLWRSSGTDVARTPTAEARAAVDPPDGNFSWRFPDTPHQLVAMWNPSEYTTITKAAIMKFENLNDMTVDGLPGPAVWRQLMNDAIAGKRQEDGEEGGYSYVYVHREVPETATLWHDGHTIISSAANTGISGAETELGSFAVFEHLPETTMSGTNPDGTPYKDPGIKWVSYFNGGDALHNFDRSSFGTPQSLGCVELPLAASAEIYKYTPIGTLVTIET